MYGNQNSLLCVEHMTEFIIVKITLLIELVNIG